LSSAGNDGIAGRQQNEISHDYEIRDAIAAFLSKQYGQYA
jgi:hypothetical protein